MGLKNKIILNTRIDIVSMNQILDNISSWLKSKASIYICCVPIHTIMNCYDDNTVNIAVNSSDINTPDGMGVVWLLKMTGYKNVSRVYGPDLMVSTCKTYPYLRHYFLGGTQEILINLEKELKSEIPELNVVGYCSPQLSLEDLKVSKEFKKSILDSTPEIIWVALGSPKQELWMYHNSQQFQGVIMIGVGAAFDFLSGNKPQAPRWIQRSGLEWFYRFLQEPRRLWKRYLLGYPRFVVLIMIELFKKRILKR